MKNKYLMIGAVVFTALLIFSIVMIYRLYSDEKQSAEAFDKILTLIVADDTTETEPQTFETEMQHTAFEKYKAVYEQNNDFVGWIFIISYSED